MSSRISGHGDWERLGQTPELHDRVESANVGAIANILDDVGDRWVALTGLYPTM
jgi:hypothetical protein